MNSTQYNQLIIGAGFAGICTAIQLKKEGFNNFIILERGSHLGGTWRDNNYPGAACDVESHLYSFSFEQNPNWSRVFGPQQEILNYMDHCVEKYGLNPYIQLNTTVERLVFDEAQGVWQVVCNNGKTYFAQSVISCSGGLSQPALPDIKGRDDFKGTMFHSAQWDHSYDLKGKTVAVIGTGASAIQIVPAIAPVVKELQLYQRTPPWIMPKMDGDISAFRRSMYNTLPFMRNFYRWRLYWFHELAAYGFTRHPALLKFASKIAARFLKQNVKDEALRRKLTPTYTMGCKRVLLTNDYYPAVQRKNVHLITEHIDEINATGIKTKDGIQHIPDAIVFATGFYAAEGVVVFDVRGKNGMSLNEAWKDGAEAYLGTSVAGFPNLFMVVGPNTGLGHSSMILMIEAQVHYILEAIKLMKKENFKSVDVKKETQTSFNTDLQQKLNKTVWQSGGCVSWYQTKTGKNVTLWPDYTFRFMRRTKKFEVEKYEIQRQGDADLL
jgi:cation diffusion facilitator CzcD-associated flavoprotein CzcO